VPHINPYSNTSTHLSSRISGEGSNFKFNFCSRSSIVVGVVASAACASARSPIAVAWHLARSTAHHLRGDGRRLGAGVSVGAGVRVGTCSTKVELVTNFFGKCQVIVKALSKGTADHLLGKTPACRMDLRGSLPPPGSNSWRSDRAVPGEDDTVMVSSSERERECLRSDSHTLTLVPLAHHTDRPSCQHTLTGLHLS